MRSILFWIFGFLQLCEGQKNNLESARGFIHRRPLQQGSPCWNGGYSDNHYDAVEEDIQGRKLFLVAGAAVGGAALGYHLGMKHKNPVVINNNIHNEYPSPCVVVQGGGGGGGILGHHPILSNLIHGGLWGGGGGVSGNRITTNRQSDINWSRAVRQFNRVFTEFPERRGQNSDFGPEFGMEK